MFFWVSNEPTENSSLKTLLFKLEATWTWNFQKFKIEKKIRNINFFYKFHAVVVYDAVQPQAREE